MVRIGVLAIQGDFIEHQHALARLGVEARFDVLPIAPLDGGEELVGEPLEVSCLRH